MRDFELLVDKVDSLVARRRALGMWSERELAEYRRELLRIFGIDDRESTEG